MNRNPLNPMNPLNPEPLTDAQVEAIVADAIAAEASSARREAAPPSSAIVWWRAQMRARQEATMAVERPLTIVHALAIACGAGLFLSIVGLAFGGMMGWVTNLYTSVTAPGALASIDLTSRWITVPMTAMLISVVIASIAAFVILADE
jgi:hypothetical protein